MVLWKFKDNNKNNNLGFRLYFLSLIDSSFDLGKGLYILCGDT